MSRPDNSHLVIAAARRRAASTRKRAVTALRRMENAGAPITFDTVAREAHVSRSWLYNQGDLRAEVQRLRQRQPPSTTTTAIPNRQRASNDSLLRRLEVATGQQAIRFQVLFARALDEGVREGGRRGALVPVKGLEVVANELRDRDHAG